MDEGSLCSRRTLLGLVEQRWRSREEELESQDRLQALVGQLVTKGPGGADKPKKKRFEKRRKSSLERYLGRHKESLNSEEEGK